MAEIVSIYAMLVNTGFANVAATEITVDQGIHWLKSFTVFI